VKAGSEAVGWWGTPEGQVKWCTGRRGTEKACKKGRRGSVTRASTKGVVQSRSAARMRCSPSKRRQLRQ